MSILLPHVMEYNLTSSAGKYVMIARALDEDITNISVIEAAIKAVEGIRKIFIELKIPQRLSEYEVRKMDLPSIANLAASFPFLDSLPRELPKNEIETILIAAF
ncbi:alcohol dehydrogenase, iron-dependent domain protein [Leptospira interrogans serovar Pyrogenes str. 200701872]|nr:alcohol dehydrogenase, iron-dependent domain protein [Leptospira interrogans serovar Pyrogenes str. 200701872]